jgi:hypothetical protein
MQGRRGGQRSVTKANSDPLLQPAGWTSAGSWSRDGITRQFDFHGCDHHLDATTSRCEHCRAKHVGNFVQVQSNAGHGGVTLGSPLLIRPQVLGVAKHKPSEENRILTYNGPVQRKKKP